MLVGMLELTPFFVIRAGNVRIRRGDVYDEFKAYSRKHDVEVLLGSIKEFVKEYNA